MCTTLQKRQQQRVAFFPLNKWRASLSISESGELEAWSVLIQVVLHSRFVLAATISYPPRLLGRLRLPLANVPAPAPEYFDDLWRDSCGQRDSDENE